MTNQTSVGSYMDVPAGHSTGTPSSSPSSAKQGISGVECLAGIPGLVGASPIQNIGAYGQEVAATIVSASALSTSMLPDLNDSRLR